MPGLHPHEKTADRTSARLSKQALSFFLRRGRTIRNLSHHPFVMAQKKEKVFVTELLWKPLYYI